MSFTYLRKAFSSWNYHQSAREAVCRALTLKCFFTLRRRRQDHSKRYSSARLWHIAQAKYSTPWNLTYLKLPPEGSNVPMNWNTLVTEEIATRVQSETVLDDRNTSSSLWKYHQSLARNNSSRWCDQLHKPPVFANTRNSIDIVFFTTWTRSSNHLIKTLDGRTSCFTGAGTIRLLLEAPKVTKMLTIPLLLIFCTVILS